jgi:5-methylcytosine-specific restriction protein A
VTNQTERCYHALVAIRDSYPRSAWDEALRVLARERLQSDSPLPTKRTRLTTAQRWRLYRNQDGKCQRCKNPFLIDEMEDDHLLPVATGGSNDVKNRRLLCKKCNRQKGKNSPVRESKLTGSTIREMIPPDDDD